MLGAIVRSRNMKTVNELLEKVINRTKELADASINDVRSQYPETTETSAELIKHCKDFGYTKGEMIEAILLDEFFPEFTVDIDQETTEGWYP